MNQVDLVKQHLVEKGSITSMEAIMKYGVTRLSAVIYVLRHVHGLNIVTDMATKKNRYGHCSNYGIYTLKKGDKK